MVAKGGIDRSKIGSPTGVVHTAYSPTYTGKFQLPVIDIPHDSLAEGTPIPPPKPTPPPSPPQTPASSGSPHPLRSHPTSSLSLNRQFTSDAKKSYNGHISSPASAETRSKGGDITSPTSMPPPATNTQIASPRPGSKRTLNSHSHSHSRTPSLSSPPSKRPSIRKLLSLKSLVNRSSLNLSQTPTEPQSQTRSYSHSYAPQQRPESPAPSTMTGMTSTTSTTISTQPTLKKRRSGAFWRKRDSFFGLGSVGEDSSETSGRENSVLGGDTVMGGIQEGEGDEGVQLQRNRTPPPMLPEMESIGEGVRMDYGVGHSTEMSVGRGAGAKEVGAGGKESVKGRRPSGWFGGEGMFEGIR